MTGFDYFIIALFFVLIVYFGYVFKQVTGTTRKFFLADRSLPGWLAGITFISGNVSAMEILGLAGGGFVYGMVFAQYAWIGAIPAIVFLALVLVPYYYRNRIFNLLEFTGKRYGSSTRLFHSLLMLGYMVLALGTGLYAFSLALDVMFGLPLWISIIASALVLGIVTAAGGLSATVLVQFMAFSDGVALLHAIGRMEPPGGTNPWLRKYIFPGSYCPTLSETLAAIERVGLWVTDIEILRLHYAETLRHWSERFRANRDRARAIYDERFCRMWEFYLAACEMAFRNGPMMAFQIQLARRRDAVPLARDYVTDWERRAAELADVPA